MKIIASLLLEYTLIVRVFLFGRVVRNPPKAWLESQGQDVLLLPGLNENWMVFRTLGDFLSQLGYKVHYQGYLTTDSIEDC